MRPLLIGSVVLLAVLAGCSGGDQPVAESASPIAGLGLLPGPDHQASATQDVNGADFFATGPGGVMSPAEFLAGTARPLVLVGEGLSYHDLSSDGVTVAEPDALGAELAFDLFVRDHVGIEHAHSEANRTPGHGAADPAGTEDAECSPVQLQPQ